MYPVSSCGCFSACFTLCNPTKKRTAQPLAVDLESLKIEAEKYCSDIHKTDSTYQHDESWNDLKQYIKTIFKDSKFQENPKEFIKNWVIKRGDTSGDRIPHDAALSFFIESFFPNSEGKLELYNLQR